MAKKNEEQATPEQIQDVRTGSEQNVQTRPEQATPDSAMITQVENAGPKPLHALAVLHRVSGWQQAALVRMMGWEDGKVVTEAEYLAALATLSGRKLGSGRK